MLKQKLSNKHVLKYFDPKLHTELVVDASPTGLCGILTQRNYDDTVNVIAYASRALSEVESRYSQTEREALAIIWACEHYNVYVYGSEFDVITDHKPLLGILNKPMVKSTARIERLSLRLQPYKVNIVYRPGKNNPADYLSRHPVDGDTVKKNVVSSVNLHVKFVYQNAANNAITVSDLREATLSDLELQNLMLILVSQKWNGVEPEMLAYKNVKEELTIADGLILRGSRIVVPQCLRERAVKLAHAGHQGIVKTKSLLRESLWFPGIDRLVEREVSNCVPCQAATHGKKPVLEPLKMSEMPERAWTELSIDFCSPVPGEYLLVVIDDFSRFPEVEIVTSTSANVTMTHLDAIFARQGVPNLVRTDNGPPFQSADFAKFAKYLGFEHRKVTPLWPRANGEVERFMRTIGKAIRTAVVEKRNWRQELFTFLRNYRATPHTTTGLSPSELLNGRKLKTAFPVLEQSTSLSFQKAVDGAKSRDERQKEYIKNRADMRNRAKTSDLEPGDVVLVKQQKQNKLSTPFKPTPYQVQTKKGTMGTASDGHSCITRNSSFFKRIPSRFYRNERECDDNLSDVDHSDVVDIDNHDVQTEISTPNREHVETQESNNNMPVLRRSKRTTQGKIPERYRE